MRIGKLTNEQLRSVVLSRLHPRDDVLLSAGVGEDCAALGFGEEACVLSTDPVTGASQNIGGLAVHISGNDVASSGAKPVAMLVTLLVPPDKTLSEVEQVVGEIVSAAEQLGIDIVGGHTEVTDAVNRIVVSTTAVGRIPRGSLIKSSGARPGDGIIMTKYAAIEGTYILAAEYRQRLEGVLTEEEFETAGGLGAQLSVIAEGLAAAKLGATAMHDVTEGGVFGAVYELCEASGTGCTLYKNKIPVLGVTEKICACLGINPYRLIGSGSMVITAPDAQGMCGALNGRGIKATLIGKITDGNACVTEDGQLPPPAADELFSV